MSPRRLTPLVASLLTIALCRGVEPVVATPFDIRHDASELLDDLQARRGDPGALLERVQNLLAQHGDRMITHGDLCAPLAELFAIRLKELGLAESFAKTYDGTAERRLRDALRAHASEADLRTLALSYPGTQAATQAWRYLADQAWDSGRLGQYLDYARRAGESADKGRGGRITAANTLLTPDHDVDLPGTLDGLEEMWRIDLNEALEAAVGPAEPQREQRFRRIRRQLNVPARFTLTPADGEITAASDGQKIFLFDHLIGRMIGEVRTLGQVPLGQFKAKPAVTRSGFIGLGWVDDHAVLMSLDRLGEVRWRWNSPSLGPIEAISAPVVLDNLVVFSALVLGGSQEGAELRALAFRVDTGRPVWNTLVARIPLPRQQMVFAGNDVGLSSPALAVHGGSLVVLSNNGLIARLGIDGNVNRLWTYPSMGDEFDNGFGNSQTPTRQGAIASDGTYLVASPSDSPGMVFYMGPEDLSPRRFQGDGANGEVLDVVGGVALLAGPRNLALFDIAAGKVRWAVPFAGRDGVQGRIGDDRVLVSTSDQLALIETASGRITGSRGLAKGVSLAITADLVMAASNESVIGWGRGASFLDRLTKAAATHPDDYRPWGTLASFHESREDREKAFSCLLEALTRGAPVEYAERAARLVRGQLELGVGDEKSFPAPLAKLQQLANYDDRLKGEIALWRGRHAELRGDLPTAIASFQAATTFPDHRMLLRDRLEARVHVLAHNGLVRLKAVTDESLVPPARKPLPKPTSAWTIPGRHGDTLLVAGDVAVGFCDGFLTAAKVADGSLAWRRQPVRQLLGVRTTLNPNLDSTEGIPIQEVVPGSSADGAGMKNGDVLLTFQGKKTTNFDRDLRAVVATMAPRTPFTMTVMRDGAELELKGLLGGEPVEPLAANDHTLLLWLTTPLGVAGQAALPGRRQNAPEGMWFAAVDLATGSELFRYGLKPTDSDGNAPPQPQLTANDLVLTQDGNDLVCLQAHGGKAGEAPSPLWRMPLGEDGMERVRVLSPDLLWLPEDGRNRVHLIDLMTGTTRFVLPEDLAADPVLNGNTCFCLGREGRITCWDLGIGRQRWRSTKVFGRLHAVSGDGLYATDENNQLVVIDSFSGEVRRRFGEWATIESAIPGKDLLSVFARRADRSQVIARVGLAGGHVQWEQALPPGAEIQRLIETTDALGAVLQEGDHRTVLMVGKDGMVRLAQTLNGDEQVTPVDGGLLAYGSAGVRVLPNALPITPAPVSCTSIETDGDLGTVAKAALAKANWQMVGSASYALVRHRGGLLVFARLGADAKPLSLRLGDGDQVIDGGGLLAMFSPTSPQFSGAGRWIVDGAKRLSADGEQPLLVLRLQPTPDRTPGTQLSLRAECGETSDAATAPWWLRRAWRPVMGGP